MAKSLGSASQFPKQKHVRVKRSSSPVELKNDNLPQIMRPSKSFKLLKRVRSDDQSFQNLCSIEEDFALEHEGDVASFLQEKIPSAPKKSFFPKFDNKGNLLPYSVIGPTKLFINPKSNDRSTPEKPTGQVLTKTSTRLNFNTRDHTNYEEKFKERLVEIENNSKLESTTGAKKLSSMILYDKIRQGREQRTLNHFNEIQNEWNLLEKQLSIKAKKKPGDLLFNRANEYREKLEELDEIDRNLHDKDETNSFSWYMSLRESNNQKFETYIPMGQKFLGLYTRISQRPKSPLEIIRKPGMTKTSSKTFRDWNYFQEKFSQEMMTSKSIPLSQIDKEELLVVGLAKLPLEIDAVKRAGPEFLNPKLIPRPFKDEIYAEEYDFRNKTYRAV